VGVNKALGQSAHLNVEYLFARLLHVALCGDEGVRVYLAYEAPRVGLLHAMRGGNVQVVARVGCHESLYGGISRVVASLGTQPLNVYLLHDELLFQAEPG